MADALVVKESTVSLSSPTPGGSFGADPVPVIGQTKPNVLYKVFDNDLEIGQGQSDTNGDFNYSAETLNEGTHTVIIRTYLDDKATGESDPVSFTIDATPPTLDNLNILPENKLKSGATGTFSLTSEPNLRQAKIVIDHSEYQLVEDRTQPGTYTKSFTVPEKTGAYPLKVYLTDALGNATEPVIDKTLTVASAKPIPVISTFKLTAESKKISLSWEQPTDTTNLNGYRLYLGTTPLDLKPQTNVPAAATSATLENLTPETKYYVSLKAVSLDDEEGEQSPILSTTTTPDRLEITNFAVDKFQENRLYLKWELNRPADNLQNFRVKYGLKSQEYLETVTTKNNTLGWYLPDLIAGQTYYVQVEALATSGEVLASSAELKASTTDNLHHAAEPACAPQLIKNIKVVYHGQSATISWPAVSGPVSYLVYVGTKSGHYNLPTMTSNTNEIDLDLSNYRTWPQLYVSVQSKCRDGRTSDLAAPVSVSTGPEALMVIGGSILVGALWKSRRRHH